MTKTTKPLTEAIEETLANITSVAGPEVGGNDYWKRECAISHAIQFHKNNGGMMTAQQLVVNAYVFLTFLNGESK